MATSGQRRKRYKLAEARRNHHLTQDGAASEIYKLGIVLGYAPDKLGVDARTVSRWERGDVDPSPHYVRIMCRLYQQPEELLDLAPFVPDLPPFVRPIEAVSESTTATVVRTLDGHEDVALTDEDDELKRRELLVRAAGVLVAMAAPGAIPMPSVRFGAPTAPGAPWASAIRAAVVHPESVTVPANMDIATARQHVDAVVRASLSSQHRVVGDSLPPLLALFERMCDARADDGALSLLPQLADLYAIAGWTLIKGDDAMFAMLAAERSIAIARRAEDAHRVSAATRCLAEGHMREGKLESASRIALAASLPLEAARQRGDQVALSLHGAALLSAAAAAARRYDGREARDALAAAAACAGQLGMDRRDLATVFGPTNVAIHRVAIAVELGDAREAIRCSADVDLTPLPADLSERRARYLIDVARAHVQLGQWSDALQALLEAESVAGDETRSHRLTRSIVGQLLTSNGSRDTVRALAERCGISR
jgi:transcriptional regulator with XRE-family HTH domain